MYSNHIYAYIGKYYVSCLESKCTKDVYNDELRLGLFNALERITGVYI